MTYKQIKWLILTIPTLTIGIWEYVRHEFLLPYISMELGNWLAPVFVLLVSLLFLTQLFTMIEHNQEELNRAKAVQAALEEREKLARELHDGIAQSLFFLNAQMAQMERLEQAEGVPLHKLKDSVRRTNDYVRQAIANLRHPAGTDAPPWLQGVESLIAELRHETELTFHTNWAIPESLLSSKEKIELLAIVREALLNIHKHADAGHVRIEAVPTDGGWRCTIADDGKGFAPEQASGQVSELSAEQAPARETKFEPEHRHYGLNMMRDRADNMSWQLRLERTDGETRVTVEKEARS